MEKDGPYIVEMPIQRKELPPCGQRPHFDLVVVAAGDEEGLRLVEVDTSNGATVAFESIDQGSHTICQVEIYSLADIQKKKRRKVRLEDSQDWVRSTVGGPSPCLPKQPVAPTTRAFKVYIQSHSWIVEECKETRIHGLQLIWGQFQDK